MAPGTCDPDAGRTGFVGPQPVSMPVAISFSPDGARIAVATLEIKEPRAAIVNVYDARDGKRLSWKAAQADARDEVNSREVENLRHEFRPSLSWKPLSWKPGAEVEMGAG